MLTLIIATLIAFSLGGCFGYVLCCITRMAASILLALLVFGPATAEAMTKQECMRQGYGCQWSRATGGRHDGWYFERPKIGAHLREGTRASATVKDTRRISQATETNGPARPSFVSTTDLAATPPGASQVAVWSTAIPKIQSWPREASPESQLAFQQVALLTYGARNFKEHWQQAWRAR